MAEILDDPEKPETWTADYAWSLIDQRLLNLKLHELILQMREKLTEIKETIWVEGVKRGNPLYARIERLKQEKEVAEEFAQKKLDAAIETWEAQGYKPCHGIYHAVQVHVIFLHFELRKDSVSRELLKGFHPLPEREHITACLRQFSIKLGQRQSRWRKRIEVLGKEANYALVRDRKAEAESARRLLLAQAAANRTPELARRPIQKKMTSSEDWQCEDTIPTELSTAVKHIHRAFREVHFACSLTTKPFCYALLHDGNMASVSKEHGGSFVYLKKRVGAAATKGFHRKLRNDTPPATFKAFVDLYLDTMALQAVRSYKELIKIGQLHEALLKAKYPDWALKQTISIVRSEAPKIEVWVQRVCDKPVHEPNDVLDAWTISQEWRAPRLLVMKPAGVQPYEPARNWERTDSENTSRWLEKLREQFILRLALDVYRLAGQSALELATQPVAVDADQRSQGIEAYVTGAGAQYKPNTAIREARKVKTQARYKRWRIAYSSLKKNNPNMSDVWCSQQIAKKEIAEDRDASTIRKHMRK